MPVYIAVSPAAADLQSFIQDRFEGQEREIKALLTTVYESELDLVTAVDAVKAYVDFAGFEERLRRIEKRIGLIETTPSEVPVLPADQQPSLEEWDEDEIPAYLNDCAKWYHSTYAYLSSVRVGRGRANLSHKVALPYRRNTWQRLRWQESSGCAVWHHHDYSQAQP
jgi:hypothetical protein